MTRRNKAPKPLTTSDYAEAPAKLRPDAAEIAFRVMQEATGEAPEKLPPAERAEKNADSVKRGAKGGQKGGRKKAANLTAEQRGEAAAIAADAR